MNEQQTELFSRIGEKEIRFAVVMYGGVSLAIYINGVAQELLKMCRSTVAGRASESLKSTETVYQKISGLLANKPLLDELSQPLTDAYLIEDEARQAAEIERLETDIGKKLNELIEAADTPKTKFVVDILTGTSAGGINAIFLAKALANNQDIEQLKELWLNEGDISVLINDKKSVKDIALSAPDKAKSLLNSNRMYLKLLEAFDAMKADSGKDSPFVEELDLFVPTTDFKGTVVPLRLFDAVVEEKRFRQVFHFRYDRNETTTDEQGNVRAKNDFREKHNPMLALAARATSSFPFAFEPMRLSRAVEVIEEGFEDWREKKTNLEADGKKFFPNIIAKDGNPIDWTNRDLVDGGVLDNKPFGYALDVLAQRRADFQVERKLLFVEPSPESFTNKNRQNADAPPDVLENAVASLSSIPSYETIREDLEKLLERNRLIERVNRLIGNAEKDVYEFLTIFQNTKEETSGKSGEFWEAKGLEDIVNLKGRAVLPYYRLRVAVLTDDLARLTARITGIEQQSENFLAVRFLVRAWRDNNFKDYRKDITDEKTEKTVLAFLRDFDLNYRLRRLRFVQQKGHFLHQFDKEFEQELEKRQTLIAQIRERENRQKESEKDARGGTTGEEENQPPEAQENAFVEQNQSVPLEYMTNLDWENPDEKKSTETAPKVETKPSEIIWLVYNRKDKEDLPGIEQIRLVTAYFQNQLSRVYKELQKQKENLFFSDSKLFGTLKSIKITPDNLKKLLELSGTNVENFSFDEMTDAEILEKLKIEHREIYEQIGAAAVKLQEEFNKSFEKARRDIGEILSITFIEKPPELADKDVDLVLINAVGGYLAHYYSNFDEYDQLSFPIYYETSVGEAVKVDVMRISPSDAKSLFDEKERKAAKLAGESLFHFGAFLDRAWRKNDIMWGRLDGAERLITALLPDKKYERLRSFLTKEAHLTILDEEFRASNSDELRDFLAKTVVQAGAGSDFRKVINGILENGSDQTIEEKMKGVLGCVFDKKDTYNFIKKHYQVDRNLEPKPLLESISRSTRVTGDILEAVAEKHHQAGDNLRWVSRLGQIFGGLVKVAAPQTVWYEFLKHWLMLLYFFEVVLIIGSTIFVKPEVQQFGIVALILTLITHFTAITLHDFMQGGKIIYLLRVLAVGLIAILMTSGIAFIYSFFFDASVWKWLVETQESWKNAQTWVRLLPIALLVLLFAVTFSWRFVRQKIEARRK